MFQQGFGSAHYLCSAPMASPKQLTASTTSAAHHTGYDEAGLTFSFPQWSMKTAVLPNKLETASEVEASASIWSPDLADLSDFDEPAASVDQQATEAVRRCAPM